MMSCDLARPPAAAGLLLIACFAFASAGEARAAFYSFDNGGGTNNWNTGANWSGNVVPDGGDSTAIHNWSVFLNTVNFVQSTQLANGAELTINYGGSLTTTGGSFPFRVGTSGKATFNLNGGSLTATSSTSSVAGSNSAINHNSGSAHFGTFAIDGGAAYNMAGGSFATNGTLDLRFSGNGIFRQTGGQVTVGNTLQFGGTGTYEISGGSLTVKGGTNLFFRETGGKFRVVGGEATAINLKSARDDTNTAQYEFVLTQGEKNITTAFFNGFSVKRSGTLTAKLDGGVLLTDDTSFDLVTANSFNGNYYSTDPDGLWTTTTVVDYSGIRDATRITMDASLGTLNYTTGESLEFGGSGLQYGHVELTGDPNPWTIGIFFDLLAGDQSLLEAALDDAGIAYEAGAHGYDLMVLLGTQYGTSDFAWDFRDIDPNLRVGSMMALMVPEPASWMLLAGCALLLGLLVRFRRPVESRVPIER